MKHLSEVQLKEIKEKLLADKLHLEKELNKFSEENKNVPNDYECKFENLGEDEDSNAQEVAEYEKCKNLEHVLETSVQKIVRALDRIANKTYGTCLECKKEIPFDRLEARPESGHCVACKAKLGLE